MGDGRWLTMDRLENNAPSTNQRLSPNKGSTLSASLNSNHSLFAFSSIAPTEHHKTVASFDFLPSPSFDDLQSSISGDSTNDFTTQLSALGGTNTGGNKAMMDEKGTAAGRATNGPRPARTSSLLRRQSNSTRQSSVSSTTSGTSGAMDPPSGPLAVRTRRQSQYPPISGSGTANATRAPRKSIGPGVIDSDYSKPAQRRRPSLATSTSSQGLSDSAGISARANIGGQPSYTDGARGLTASRAAKTKSLQPPSRQGQTHLAAGNVGTPEHSRSSSFAGKSPGKSNGRGTSTPSSTSKRMSIMPGMPGSGSSHATGLGARTVSPTDARRAKRLSILQGPPPIPDTPPQPMPDKAMIRQSSRSPSMLPRKVSTPLSSRTTPDPNRKSYSSGLSIGSTASYSTSQTSAGSLQPRASLQPQASSSRLPTPKPRSLNSSAGNNEEEEVPPVPAIPKAYESPKDTPVEQPFFNKRASNMNFDTSSINSTSSASLSGKVSMISLREPPRNDREPKPRHFVSTTSSSEADQNQTTPINTTKKKNLKPLRLPPLNLLPLSSSTAAKVAILGQDSLSPDGNVTPPPRRVNTKTPSSPMTASKASFFSRNRHEEKAEFNLAHMRSSSSTHRLRAESSQPESGSESSRPIPMNSNRQQRQAVSPYTSSSLPKNGGEHSFMPRSKTSGDFSTAESATEAPRPPRLTGPRAHKLTKTAKTDTPPKVSSPDEPTTPSSGSSLRRKLSLGWKRSTSKSNISHAASERADHAPLPPKHDNMPPPRLPASATLNNLNNYAIPSPSPSIKSTTYLDSKRRKSSASSLSIFSGHDRTRSDSWGVNGSPKKEQAESNLRHEKTTNGSSTRSTSSVMQKMLSSKSSTGGLRAPDRWTVDLDKDDLIAEEYMKKLASKRKETEHAARILDALRKRATPKERVSAGQALQVANLNIYERGEIVDFKEVYFCGTQHAAKHIGDLTTDAANFGYDDERGDYSIVAGDHLSYRYEIIDVLGKGSFGQVVRCIDHKTGGLVAIKIIRNKKRFHQQALVEVNILQKLREWVCFFLYDCDSNANRSKGPS
jgi:dual specificity tyrosine-phosphorylation-regulated kinase 2/3/4